MRDFRIITTNGNKGTHHEEWFRIHAVECADVKREERIFGEGWTAQAETAEKLAAAKMQELIDQDGTDSGWVISLWYILPCCIKREVK